MTKDQSACVSKHILEHEISEAAHKLYLKRIGKIKYGWNNDHTGSIGQLCQNQKGEYVWLKLKAEACLNLIDPYAPWQGWEEADKLDVRIKKPAYLGDVIHWKKKNVIFSTLLISFVEEPICSTDPWINDSEFLSDVWLDRLKKMLRILSIQPTKRVNTTQDLITRGIRERFGSVINCVIDQWETVHGDLHWSNLTKNTPFILDWDNWGIAPQGLEISFLYCFSLNNTHVLHKIRDAS